MPKQSAAYWQNEYETAQEMLTELRKTATKARDLIGNQRGDVTGAALDAWVLLSAAVGKCENAGDSDD